MRDEKGQFVKVFERRYRHNLSQQEKAQARAAINAQMEKQGKKASKLGAAIRGGVSSRIKFDPVAWVVDSAVWNDPAKTLDVLSGDISVDPSQQ